MNEEVALSKAYAFFAPVYDVFFGKVLEHGRRSAIALAEPDPGAHILEVGVGTGLSLASYPPHARVTGIDLSPAMLAKARARVARRRLRHVEALLSMDATDMAFEDGSFDAVICMYMVSVVPDPRRVLEEMRRVCKPGGKLVVVNHFQTESKLVQVAEFFLKPLHYLVRFRNDLNLEAFMATAQLPVESVQHANLMNYSTVLVFRNAPQA
ncbi:MAG: methyltransferase domain-containing protein [Candidatus Marinimicrobia bacterium]|nr:methyltransferase domain-containing protein [Candidatus Neomarinimicrobiota bacterium]